MANNEAQSYSEFYYESGRKDYLTGNYNQPFPFPTSGVLDDFEKECNLNYTKGYQEERISFESFSFGF